MSYRSSVCVPRPRSCRPTASTADIYLVIEDFGARAGCAWRETDEADTDVEIILQNLLSGQYAYAERALRRATIQHEYARHAGS
ncbi:hypothetical protein BJS_03371 [Bradyrhizobium japonicum SEMIA 5079]|nr:hypothetical protein BJS_03371 [Bradyrhizobium japonicum SEMIA 5079]